MFTDSQEIQEIRVTFMTARSHQEAAKECLPVSLPPLLLLWRLAPLNSALRGQQALVVHQGGEVPATSCGRVQDRGILSCWAESMAMLGQSYCPQEAFPGGLFSHFELPLIALSPLKHILGVGVGVTGYEFDNSSRVCFFLAGWPILGTGPGTQ